MGIFGDKVSDKTLSDLITGGSKPAFDPSQPFDIPEKPAFDPSKPFEAAPSVGRAEDAAKSVGSGLADFTAGALGGAGTARVLASTATDYLGRKLGAAPDKVQAFKDLAARAANMTVPSYVLANAPSARDIINSAPDPIVSPDYKPEYFTGKVAKTGAELLPGMLFGGGTSVPRQFLSNVVAPAITSETLGKLGEGTAAEPWLKVAGALAGGVTASKVERALENRAATAPLTTLTGDTVVKKASDQFNQARAMDLTLSPDFPTKTAADMRAALKNYDPVAQAPVFRAADRIESLGAPNVPAISPAQRLQAEMNWEGLPATPPRSPVAMNDVELIRKQLSELRTSTDPSMRSAAKAAQEALTKNQLGLTPADVLAGDAAAYTKTLGNAVNNYRQGKLSQTLEGKMNLAELNSNTPVGFLDAASGAQALQRTMKQLARPVNNTNIPVAKKLGFNNEAVAAITNAADGNGLIKTADMIDRLVPAKLGAIPSAIIRHIGGLSVKKQVNALNSLILSGSPHAQEVAAGLSPVIVDGLTEKARRILRLAAPQVREQVRQSVGQADSQ